MDWHILECSMYLLNSSAMSRMRHKNNFLSKVFGLNSEFSFSWTDCWIKVKELNLPDYLPIAGRKRYSEALPHWHGTINRCYMSQSTKQTQLFRIWKFIFWPQHFTQQSSPKWERKIEWKILVMSLEMQMGSIRGRQTIKTSTLLSSPWTNPAPKGLLASLDPKLFNQLQSFLTDLTN